MTTHQGQADAAVIVAISQRIKPILAGSGSGVQGGVLADLVSLWLAGHHPDLREGMLIEFVRLTRELIPPSEKEIFGERGFPTGGLS